MSTSLIDYAKRVWEQNIQQQKNQSRANLRRFAKQCFGEFESQLLETSDENVFDIQGSEYCLQYSTGSFRLYSNRYNFSSYVRINSPLTLGAALDDLKKKFKDL